MKQKPKWLSELEHRDLQKATDENMRDVVARQNSHDSQKEINKLFSN